jgi:RNA polymerase sigma factor (sigma-70 family)
MTREREREIIDAVLSGDVNAFEELVTEYQTRVYNIALKMTGNREDAFDISQEAFIKAYKALNGFRGESSFGSWLYRLTANMSVDLSAGRTGRSLRSLFILMMRASWKDPMKYRITAGASKQAGKHGNQGGYRRRLKEPAQRAKTYTYFKGC